MTPTGRTALLTGAAAAPRLESRAVGELYTSSDPVTVTHLW
ncbi:hypothetical protein [Streptomyces sp. NPDC057616]